MARMPKWKIEAQRRLVTTMEDIAKRENRDLCDVTFGEAIHRITLENLAGLNNGEIPQMPPPPRKTNTKPFADYITEADIIRVQSLGIRLD